MIRFLVSSRVSHATGRRLADLITERQGKKCYYYNRNPIPHPELRHIRFGSRRATSANCLNKLAAVQLASDKLESLLRFQNAGVPIPQLTHKADFAEGAPFTRVFRKRERHAGNDNPYKVQAGASADLARAATYDYCLEFIAVEDEFRVHVFSGNAIWYQKKFPREGVQHDPDIRSANRGWVLRTIANPSVDNSLAAVAVQAVVALGLDFGAVDVLRSAAGAFFVLEVNTAPGLQGAKAMRYAEAMVEWDKAHPE